MTILIVDDEPGHIELIRRALADAAPGAEISAAGTLREYRESVAKKRPDIALIDLNLPDGMAVEVLSYPPESNPFPVVVITSQGDEQRAVEALKAGAMDYVVKSPAAFAALPKTVEATIREWGLRCRNKEAEEAIARSQRFSEAVLNSIADSISIVDVATLRIVDANAAFLKTYGVKREEARGKFCYELTHGRAEPCSGAEDPCPVAAMLSSGEPVTAEHLHHTPDGRAISVEVTAHPLRDPQGKITMAIHVARDVTARKLVREKLKETETQLAQSQKMDSVGRLAGGVAHDFNNMLTAITGYAGFLYKELAKDDPKREDVKEILNAAEQAAGLTAQLLAFSRKQLLNPQILDLNAVVGGKAKMLERLVGEAIKFETRLVARPCRVKADPGQIDQVLINLVVNARDAMPKGGTLVLETGVVTPEGGFFLRHPDLPRGPLACLSVSDSGCGLTEEVRKHLFEPFFTTKGKGKGTGLGLSTVFGVVKQSGGEIEVESGPDSGTTFRIYLPYLETAVQDKDEDKGGDIIPRGTETILLAEDEESLRRLCERLLRSLGYTVIVAAGGKEALEAAERHGKPVDLLMTDVFMPGMSGRELARELARRKLADRTFYMSGYSEDVISQHGVLEPGLAFIYKPFTLETLSVKLRAVLDGPADQAKA